jgi:hypothetical protein
MSIIDNPNARPVAYAYSERPEPGLYPEPPAAVQPKALRLGKGALGAILLGTVAVGAALGFAVFDYAGSQPRPAVVAPSNGSPDSRPPAAPAPDPGQAVPAPAPPAAPDPGPVAAPPAPAPAPPAAPDPGPVAAPPAPAPAPPAAPDPGPVAAAPAPAPAPGNTNVIIGGGIVGGGGGNHGYPHSHCHWVQPPPHYIYKNGKGKAQQVFPPPECVY